MWVAVVFLLAATVAYGFQKELLNLIIAPLHGEKLIYLTPGGGFSFIFQVTMYAGLLVALPMLLYQLYAFVKPAFPKSARRSATKVVLSAAALMSAGILYGYCIAVPAALDFLNTFAGEAATPSLTADSYLSFFLAYIGGLAVLALLPLLLLFWHWIRPLTPGDLLKSERWVIAGAFIIAAVITPTPDVVNQTMIAGPVVGLYQLGAGSVLVSLSRQKKTLARTRKTVRNESTERPKRTIPSVTVYAAPARRQELRPAPSVPVMPLRSVDGFFPQMSTNNRKA